MIADYSRFEQVCEMADTRTCMNEFIQINEYLISIPSIQLVRFREEGPEPTCTVFLAIAEKDGTSRTIVFRGENATQLVAFLRTRKTVFAC